MARCILNNYNLDSVQSNIIKNTECILLDMDGTVYLGNRWIDGAPEFIAAIRASGRKLCFLTNNSSKSAAAYVEKLRAMGLIIDPTTELVTSGQATADYLLQNYAGKRVFLLGNDVLKQEFTERCIMLDDRKPDIVVTAFDTSLDYKKMCAVCDFLRGGLPYIATHPDYNCPTETGFAPDIGAIHAFINASIGRMPDLIVGKPNSTIIDYALRKSNAERSCMTIIGDRLYTDIASGSANGIASILVLSGETSLCDLDTSDIKPDLIFDSVADITALL